MCCRCNTPIDPTLRYPHDMSVSLEHLIPMRDDGPTTPENCGVSHLDCNRRDGGKGGWERKLRTSRDW